MEAAALNDADVDFKHHIIHVSKTYDMINTPRLRQRPTAHALRHTHASLLLADGVEIDTISRRLGHKNIGVTKEIYLHVTKKLEEKDKEQIQGFRIAGI